MTVTEPRTVSGPALLPVGALLLAGVACYLVGGIGYGMAEEYGMSITEAGLWQLVLAGSALVGSVWAGIVVLLGRLSGRRVNGLGLAALGVALCFAAGGVGSVLGGEAHDLDRQAAERACTDGTGAAMRGFADAARPAGSPYVATPQGTPSGCLVDIAVPADLDDPFAYVTAEVGEIGFIPLDGDSWGRGDLHVDMRAEQPEGEKEYLVAFYGQRG